MLHEDELSKQKKFADGELEWKHICKEEYEAEMKRMNNEKKRKCEWSGEEVLHDFASLAHNLPLLPEPMPMQLYLFNKYEKIESKPSLATS